jgi:competence protein ComEC
MGFWVMPAAITAIVLLPFGLDGFFWKAAAGGVDIMLRLGNWTRELPGAVTVFPHWPSSALGVIAIGGVWLCLMRANWRFFGLANIPLGAALIIAQPQPDIYFSDDGTNVGVAIETADGNREMAVFDRRKGRFDSEVWMELAGFDIEASKPVKLSDVSSCDDFGCVVKKSGRAVAISSSALGLEDDCKRSDLVIALYSVSEREKKSCHALMLDIWDARRNGAHAIFVSEQAIRVKTVLERRGVRPWT